MHEMTASNLRSAFGGESQAYMRYQNYSEKALRDGLPNISRLFQAISRAEQVHASNHFRTHGDIFGPFLVPSMAGFGLGETVRNLGIAIEGETYEILEMYPAFRQIADFQKEKKALRSFTYAWEAEKTHAQFFKRAKASAEKGQDLPLRAVQVCIVCGYTAEGTAPDKCPICEVGPDKFLAFE